jgi:hypothetical protein
MWRCVVSTQYKVGQKVEIVERYMLARCSGQVAGPRKYSTATVTDVGEKFAQLSTGERINLTTGKLEKAP